MVPMTAFLKQTHYCQCVKMELSLQNYLLIQMRWLAVEGYRKKKKNLEGIRRDVKKRAESNSKHPAPQTIWGFLLASGQSFTAQPPFLVP